MRRRNIHYRPSKGQAGFMVVLMVGMGLFGLFGMPNEGPFLAFKALWVLMTFGGAISTWRAAHGKDGGYGHYEITEEETGGSAGTSDAEARLLELRGLYDKGLITEEEYEEKRKDILAGL